MSEVHTVEALLSEQGAALFPAVVEVRNNTPTLLCRTGARIGVAPYSSADVEFAAQADLAVFVKKVGAQARLNGDDPAEVYPLKVLRVAQSDAQPEAEPEAQPGAQPEQPETQPEAQQPDANAEPADAPAPATAAKRTTKKGAVA